MPKYHLNTLNLDTIMKHLPEPTYVDVGRTYEGRGPSEDILDIRVPGPFQRRDRISEPGRDLVMELYRKSLASGPDVVVSVLEVGWHEDTEESEVRIRLQPQRKTPLAIRYKGMRPQYVDTLCAEIDNVQHTINERHVRPTRQLSLATSEGRANG